MAEKDLAGRKAIVTGSATGLGRSIALRLAERGADVIINCTRSIDEGEATVAACNEAGAQAQLVAADVSTEEGAAKLFALLDTRYPVKTVDDRTGEAFTDFYSFIVAKHGNTLAVIFDFDRGFAENIY